jgi:hypothetical protein
MTILVIRGEPGWPPAAAAINRGTGRPQAAATATITRNRPS